MRVLLVDNLGNVSLSPGMFSTLDLTRDKHLEHGLRQVEVDAAACLWTTAGPVESQFVLFRFGERTLDCKWAPTMAVIVDKVDESRWLVGHMFLYNLTYGVSCTLK